MDGPREGMLLVEPAGERRVVGTCVSGERDRQRDRQADRQAGREAGREGDGNISPTHWSKEDNISLV